MFKSDLAILEEITNPVNSVICAPLGSGKSQSAQQFIFNNSDKNILLVVNTVEDQKSYCNNLLNKLVVYNASQEKDNPKNVENFQSLKTYIENQRGKTACITKKKFDDLFYTDEDFLKISTI